jgi:threonine dehydrogenase-like Zn-dependent dehydrogenase
MPQSPEINELAKALCAVQSVLKGAKKDSTNPHFKKSYADLSSVWEAVRQPLSDNAMAVAQLTGKDELGHYVETVMLHISGQWISGKTYATPVKDDPQAIGSAITYARRYGLSAIVGVCPEDDDAESAMSRSNHQATPEKAQPQQARKQDDL